jgi:DNA gyrase/topoisomerase IV subunit A
MTARILLTVALIAASTSPLFAQGVKPAANQAAAVAQQQQQRLAAAEEKRIQNQLNWLEQQIAKEEKVLRHRLKQAEAIRAAGIKAENNQRIKEAGTIEKNAFDAYSKRIAILEKTTAKAVQTNKNSEKKDSQAKNKASKSSPRLFRLFD